MAERKSGLHKEVSDIFEGMAPPNEPDSVDSLYAGRHAAQSASSAAEQITTTQGWSPTRTLGAGPRGTAAGEPNRQRPGLIHFEYNGRQKKMLCLIGILAAVFLVVCIHAFQPTWSTPQNSSAAEPEALKAPTSSRAVVKISWDWPEPILQLARDPMAVLATTRTGQDAFANPDTASSKESWELKGIVYSEDNPAAILGEKMVHVGDTVNGCTVLEIHPDHVKLSKDSKIWRLTLSP